jgi:hypothetical protein
MENWEQLRKYVLFRINTTHSAVTATQADVLAIKEMVQRIDKRLLRVEVVAATISAVVSGTFVFAQWFVGFKFGR